MRWKVGEMGWGGRGLWAGEAMDKDGRFEDTRPVFWRSTRIIRRHSSWIVERQMGPPSPPKIWPRHPHHLRGPNERSGAVLPLHLCQVKQLYFFLNELKQKWKWHTLTHSFRRRYSWVGVKLTPNCLWVLFTSFSFRLLCSKNLRSFANVPAFAFSLRQSSELLGGERKSCSE